MRFFAEAVRLETENKAFALLHIVENRGSSPRHSASMLVPEVGPSIGTIGGGMIERLAIDQAREALREGRSRLFHGKLTRQGPDAVGSDCGGAMTVHIAVYAKRPELVLFGAGHVNRALALLALQVGFQVTVADPWQENLNHPALPADCERISGENFTAILSELNLNPDSFVVIATNHQDLEVLEQAISLPLRYLGLLASWRKAQNFRHQLRAKGVSNEWLERLYAPVGVDIQAETPEEIAVSILAQLIPLIRHKPASSVNGTTMPGKAERSAAAIGMSESGETDFAERSDYGESDVTPCSRQQAADTGSSAAAMVIVE